MSGRAGLSLRDSTGDPTAEGASAKWQRLIALGGSCTPSWVTERRYFRRIDAS